MNLIIFLFFRESATKLLNSLETFTREAENEYPDNWNGKNMRKYGLQLCQGLKAFAESDGRTFSPRYGSSFWFDPLLPRIQLICLSLNCLYQFSPAYSSFRIVLTYSHPDTHIQLT